MDRSQFRALLRDLLLDIHDVAALEKHPANEWIPRSDAEISRAENLRRFVRDGIEALKPRDKNVNIEALEWRYYLILYGRYVEGISIPELLKRLALGERQERRLHGRALEALENILGDRLHPGESTPPPAAEAAEDSSFQVVLEPLHLERVVQEVASLCAPRVEAAGGRLNMHIPATLPLIQADRIILRQILLHLTSRILEHWPAGGISISAAPNTGKVQLEIIIDGADPRSTAQQIADDLLSQGPVRYWIERLNAGLAVEADEGMPEAQVRYLLTFPRANQSTILVVDDHEPAIRIVQRYLNHTNVQAVGTTDPTQVLPMARAVHPQAVLLDVMMPNIDGWELLQALKSDPETANIPVIICSVWDQPDLAYSLGANGFLKKPISQADLLGELSRSNLLDTSA
jgi:CheY-like chemotaxis protein